MASACNVTFINVETDKLLSKWQGQSEKTVECLFQIAKERQPTIIFIDEVDSLCRRRGEDDSESSARLKNQLLQKMDGFGSSNNGILVIGNTNLPHHFDKAFRRRFEKRIYVGLPSASEREELITEFLKPYNHTLTSDEIEKLSKQTAGFSGADLNTMVKSATFLPVNEIYDERAIVSNVVQEKKTLRPISLVIVLLNQCINTSYL